MKSTPKQRTTRGPFQLPDLLTAKEYAAEYRLHVVTVYRLAERGKLPGAVKVGGQWRIARPEDIALHSIESESACNKPQHSHTMSIGKV